MHGLLVVTLSLTIFHFSTAFTATSPPKNNNQQQRSNKRRFQLETSATNKDGADILSRITYRPPTLEDIPACYAIESASYPADEAASLEGLTYRQANAGDYFQCAMLDETSSGDGEIIGFVCGTRCDQFEEESMSTHTPTGQYLAIHSVVVQKDYRRQGIATAMLQAYVSHIVAQHRQQHHQSDGSNRLVSMLLLAKSYLLGFYVNCGFQVNRPSPIVHGQELWYELELAFSSQTSAASNNGGENFERELAQKQKATSSDLKKAAADTSSTQAEFVEHQARVFDEMASFFASDEAVPLEVVPVLEDMTAAILSQATNLRAQGDARNKASRPARVNATTFEENVYHILDVGCGAGALFEFYLQAADAKGVTVHIHGVDLAPNMIAQAHAHGEHLLSSGLTTNKKHSVSAEVADISDWRGTTAAAEGGDEKQPPQQYDLVVANACFGNIWDQTEALQKMSDRLRMDGLLCITHPLGSNFVQQLHEEDSTTVPHLLPTLPEFRKLARTLPLQVLDVVDKQHHQATESESTTYYMASATKVSFHILPQTMHLRGSVATGYGRGGKKLGFPTANLPSGLFQGALRDVPCGVYFGWAVLEDPEKKKKGRNIPHKAVVNVGFSPTFEGKENPEKIVEAHLMFDGCEESPLDPPDFYGEVMRLQLHGFIRPEMKFPSFPDLIAQISADVEDAKDALDLEFYRSFQKDSFLVDVAGDAWVGQVGGDETASWDFEDVESVLARL